jgi:radical SAM protein with 4Fe4S-binding SPASM domain
VRAYQRSSKAHPETGASLEFALTLFADNIDQLPGIVRTAAELGADRLFAQHLLPKNEDQKLQSLFYHRKAANAAFEEAATLGKALGVNVVLPKPLPCGSMTPVQAAEKDKGSPAGLAPCYLPWTSVNVHENGDVLPCCVADSSLTMGSLKKNSFEEIWNGRAYQRLRRTVNSDKPPRTCAICAMRGGATPVTYDRLFSGSVFGKVRSGLKSYLLRTKRKKTLNRLIKVRDGFNRMSARF